jgi:hypothetical protein
MGLQEVLDKVNANPSVKAAYLLEGEIYERFVAEESSVTEAESGMSFVNKALKEVLKRNTALCLFSTGEFEDIEEHVMVMEDPLGNIVGHDIPECMKEKYKDDTTLFWLCEDFVMRPEANMRDVKMVMLPKKVRTIGEAEGVCDAIMLYPASTTDLLLRKHFGALGGKCGSASAILAFNIL